MVGVALWEQLPIDIGIVAGKVLQTRVEAAIVNGSRYVLFRWFS